MAETGPTSYDGFLSYSHAADDLLAPRLQAGLQRFAKPWWKRRALHIFRDEASLSANPHLWTSITDALDDSDWFVLLLSPEAAESEWVNREIDYWREHKDPHKILPVVTDGEFGWADGDVVGDAVPESLRRVFADEPRWVDLRFARTEAQLNLRHGRFRDAVADIAAAIRGVPKDELESEEIRQHRRTMRTAWTAGVAILALGVAATVGAIVAYNAQQDAQAERDRAIAAEESATEERDRAIAAEEEAERQQTIAEQERDRAEEQTEIAQANADLARSRGLAASAINVLDDDPELSVLLSMEAAKGADPAFESVSALHQALQSHRTIRTITWPDEWPMDPGTVGSISPDGRYVAVSGAGHQMAVWDLEVASDEPIWTFEVPYPDYAVIVPYFNTDGSHVIATVAWRSRIEAPEDWPAPPAEVGVHVFDSRNGGVIRHIRGPNCPIVGLFQAGRFLDEARPVGAGVPLAENCSLDLGASIWLIDLNTGETTFGHEGPVPSGWGWGTPAAFSEDGRFLSFGEASGVGPGKVVDLATGEQVFETPPGLGDAILSRDGSRLLRNDRKTVSLWDIDSATELWSTDTPNDLVFVRFSEDESQVYASSYDGTIRVLDADSGTPVQVLKGHRAYTWWESMTVDGSRLASFSGDGSIRVWDLTARPEGEISGFDLPGYPGIQAGNVVGDRVATGLWDGVRTATVIFSSSSGEIDHLFPGFGASTVRLSPDGTRLAGQPFVEPSVIGPVQIRDAESGDVLVELEDLCTYDYEAGAPGPDCAENPGSVGIEWWYIAFSPDGSMLAMSRSYAYGDKVGVWDVQSGRRLTWLTVAPGGDVVVRFSPDSDLLYVAGKELAVYEAEEWSEVATAPMGWSWWDLLVSPDGRYVYGADTKLGIVKLDTDTWEYVGDPFPHTGIVRDISLSSDGALIASASNDGVGRIWDTTTGDLLQEIPLGDYTLSHIEFLGGDHLLIIPQDRPAAVMTIDIPELLDIARSRVTRGFTDDECVTYHIDPCPDLETIRGG